MPVLPELKPQPKMPESVPSSKRYSNRAIGWSRVLAPGLVLHARRRHPGVSLQRASLHLRERRRQPVGDQLRGVGRRLGGHLPPGVGAGGVGLERSLVPGQSVGGEQQPLLGRSLSGSSLIRLGPWI